MVITITTWSAIVTELDELVLQRQRDIVSVAVVAEGVVEQQAVAEAPRLEHHGDLSLLVGAWNGLISDEWSSVKGRSADR